MSWNDPPRSNSPLLQSPRNLFAILATILIFTVFGLFFFLLTSHVPSAWEACNFSFPTIGFLELLRPTLVTATDKAILEFRDYFVPDPTFKIAAAACIWSVWKTGKPLILFPAIVWLIVASTVFLILTVGSEEGVPIHVSDIFVLFCGVVISLFCGYLAKFFW